MRIDTLGLLALGSIGRETARADEFSDVNFFVIVLPGAKTTYLEELEWLEAPIRWPGPLPTR